MKSDEINWGDGHAEPCAYCEETGYERDGLARICNGCSAIRDEIYEGAIIWMKKELVEMTRWINFIAGSEGNEGAKIEKLPAEVVKRAAEIFKDLGGE